jgi:hypothetical protein
VADDERDASPPTSLECPLTVLRPPVGPGSVVLPLVGVVDQDLTPGLCAVVRALFEADGVDVVTCDATNVAADLELIGVLARMHMTALELGRGLRVRRAGSELCLLVEVVGLADVLRVDPEVRPSVGEGG